jgi:hypothetical protein
MRRGIAIVLMTIFGWLMALPAFAASTDLTVPACCRRSGQHHCMMQEQAMGQAGPATVTVAPQCPFWHRSDAVATQARFCALGVHQAVFAGLTQHPAVSPQTQAAYRISHDRSRQKRGPPSLILC